MRGVAAYILGLCCLAPAAMAAAAQTKPPDSPPARLTLADFARHPSVGGAWISPNGKYLAMLVPVGDENRLDVVELATLKATAAYNIGNHQFILSVDWINNNMLAWQSGLRDGPADELYRTGDLMVGYADASKAWRISDSDDSFLAAEPGVKDSILVTGSRGIYRLGIYDRWKDLVRSIPYDNWSVLADKAGKVRMATGSDDADRITAAWDPAKDEWQELRRSRNTDATITPVGLSADEKQVYVLSDVDASTSGIYLGDLSGKQDKLLFRDPRVDIDTVLYNPGSHEPAGVLTQPDYPEYHFFDESGPLATLYADLRAAFPGCAVLITSSSDDGRLAIVSVGSDTRPGDLYLLDTGKHSLQHLFSAAPWIDQQSMAQKSAFMIKARDGTALHGYLTLPRDAGEKDLPLVVLPHGGPHAVRDTWSFDSEVQVLAYHGYAVLQLNYRGSGGYGHGFERLGYRHWGTTMQDDLTDATRWAIQEGIADPHRVCIYGASYGGYAALMGVIREPDLYRCAVGYAGSYDLTVQRKKSDSAKTKYGRAYFDETRGVDIADLKARSPVYNVAGIKVPLLLVHGGDDERVPIKNFHELTEALDKAGKTYETLVKSREAHGFTRESDITEFYARLLDFLDRNIGSRRPQATQSAAAAPASGAAR